MGSSPTLGTNRSPNVMLGSLPVIVCSANRRNGHEMVTGTAPSAFLMGSFATGDIEFMVEDIVGAWDDASYVGVTDFRGIYYSSGTTP